MKRAVIAINVLFGLSLIPWLAAVFATFFMLGAPGSEENTAVLSVILAIWTYPLTYLVALVGSIIAYKKNASKNLTLGLALLPLVNIVWLLLSLALI